MLKARLQGSVLLMTVLMFGGIVTSEWSPFFWVGCREPLDGLDVVIKTSSGQIGGKRRPWNPEAGGHIKEVEWYLGIPYAEPPVGDLRFRATRPVQPWKGVLNATRFRAVCPQLDRFEQLPSNEDCLTLNIYCPHQESGETDWPVMVYIHGGSYRVGTGASYLGHLLAQRGVIVVTMNYRLGILGFISAKHRLLPGNNGILDQIEALRWVKNNIKAFGGDPDKITIFGNSAGGASVGILTVSPLAAGLFQQSIIQSGSPLSFWAMHNDTVDLEKHTRAVAKVYRCNDDTLEELVSCLRSVSAEDLGQCSGVHIPSISVSNTNFRPHVDNFVIPRGIHQLYEEGDINSCRVVMGVVEREWSRHIGLMISELMMNRSKMFDRDMNDGMNRTSFEEAIKFIFCNKFGWGEIFAKVVTHEYTNWTHVQDPIANRETYISFMTDFGMVAPTMALADILHIRKIPVYTYQFNHKSSADKNQWQSNAHLVELHYIFGSPFLGFEMIYGDEKSFSEEDKKMSRFMMDIWAQFAKYGNPSLPSNPWDEYQPETSSYLSISLSETQMKTYLKSDGVTFWNKIIPSLQKQIMGIGETRSHYESHTVIIWTLSTICITLCVVMVVLSWVLCQLRKRHSVPNGPVSV